MLRALICSDRCRYGRGNSWLIGYLLFPGFRFSFWFRLHQWANASGKHRLVRVFLTWCVLRQSLKTGIQINPGAQVGPGLYMPHFGGIVVNPKAVIGANCYLSHNVLIGKVHAGKRAGVPVVGDNVFIGAGAVILGNIAIGNNAAIGVNSVVIDDVPAGVLVAGAPARVVAEKSSDEILGLK